MTTQTDGELAKQAREVEAVAARIWKLMVDLTLEEKVMVLDRLAELLSMEEATHEPLQ